MLWSETFRQTFRNEEAMDDSMCLEYKHIFNCRYNLPYDQTINYNCGQCQTFTIFSHDMI